MNFLDRKESFVIGLKVVFVFASMSIMSHGLLPFIPEEVYDYYGKDMAFYFLLAFFTSVILFILGGFKNKEK